MSGRRIFLSCVSSEYKDLRESLSRYLEKAGCDAVFQEAFPQAPEDTLVKLDGLISGCDAVLHILGSHLGFGASPHALAEYRDRTPDFLVCESKLREGLGDLTGLSYTQWEAYMARHHGLKLLVYVRDGAILEAGQERHRLRLASIGRHAAPFRDREDLFGQLIGDLRKILPELPPWKPVNLPGRGEIFTGREADVERLHERLSSKDHLTTATALHGLGGVGKTRLAVEYGLSHASEFSAMLFVQANTEENLHRELAALAGPAVLDLPEFSIPDESRRRRAVLHWLQRNPGWLLILDNVDGQEAQEEIEKRLWNELSMQDPESVKRTGKRGGRLLITTRMTKWSGRVRLIELGKLDAESSIAYLKERTDGRRVPHPNEDVALQFLVKELDGLPLALEQAAAFIDVRTISFPGYLKIWQTERDACLTWCQNEICPISVAVAWKANFDCISPEAKSLLDTLAFLAPSPIPRVWMKDLDSAWIVLRQYSLVHLQTEPPDTFILHPLVQAIVRLNLKENEKATSWEKAIALLMASVPGNGFSPEGWPDWKLLAPHVKSIRELTEQKGQVNLLFAELLNRFAQFLQFSTGAYKEAEPLYRQVLETSQRILGKEHPDTLSSLNNLAGLLESQGNYTEAEPLYRQALKTRKLVLGEEHPHTLSSLNDLALLLLSQGFFAEAEPLCRQSLEACQRVFGAEHPNSLFSLNNLAGLLQSQGKYSEAEPLFRQALEACKRVLGTDHPNTLTSLNNLAGLFQRLGNFSDAEPLYRQALEARQRVLGMEHPDTLSSLNNLASLLGSQGNYIDSEHLFRQALEAYQRVLGAEHPETLTSLNNLAALLQRLGNFADAEPLYRQALEARQRVLGVEHPDTLSSLNNLAVLFKYQGKYSEADPLYSLSLKGLLKVSLANGQPHPNLNTAIANYSNFLIKCGLTADQAKSRILEIIGKRKTQIFCE